MGAIVGRDVSVVVSSGSISKPHDVVQMVFGFASQMETGKGLNTLGVYQEALLRLEESAQAVLANGIIGVGFQQRVAVGKNCFGENKQVFEVHAWGTAVRIRRE